MANRITSIEDGQIDNVTIVTSRTVAYKDLDLSFAVRPASVTGPISGDVYVKKDAAAVKQSIKNLLLTNFFEKPFKPFFGGNLTGLLFELSTTPELAYQLKDRIIKSIQTYEPRAKVLDVSTILAEDYNSLNVTIVFQVVNSTEIITFTTTVSRLR